VRTRSRTSGRAEQRADAHARRRHSLRTQAAAPGRASAGAAAALDVDALAGRWLSALDAAQSALRAAGSSLGAEETGSHRRRLAEERVAVVDLLRDVARHEQTPCSILPLLAAPVLSRRLIGLPDGIAACVFDLDGVLTTSGSAHAAAWAATFDPFLLARAERGRRPFVPFDTGLEYLATISGRRRLDGVRAFLAGRGISLPEGTAYDPAGAATVHGLANRKSQLLRQRIDRQGVSAFEGSRAFLEAARSIGLRRAVVSASASTRTMLGQAGLADLIDECIDGDAMESEGLNPKPSPDTLLAACRRLDVTASETASFETTSIGIAAARDAGMGLIVRVDREGGTSAPGRCDAGVVVGDLTELFAAVHAGLSS
jgi:HAD superfamily hydrolase (TIGR01509 family)